MNRLLQNVSVLMCSKTPPEQRDHRHSASRGIAAQRALRRSPTATSLPLCDRMRASGSAQRRLSLRTTDKERHSDPLHVGAQARRAPAPYRRELEVLERPAQGVVYKQIAHELDLSTSTAPSHLHSI